ncbi:glycerophosphodiester phosphodiesterase [Pontibacter sp. SGAir0037]|uniref:glycerophosphodiester phosphodiesterase n=1 Tax=Pontibacter sp. SGAir0037 TaxID=2571030 RepID=UPI0010CCC48D|nr:glycerophosphodiester phosphodiesterase [Pontibacter sp. SGAir0037]QCR24902.1 glycerophosphodiester phosphodiesterase [Pontibacter sp. SGAir0037]
MRRILHLILFASITLSACTSKMAPTQQSAPLPDFDTEGHRGARGLMPENTVPAMLRALDLGVTTLEMDTQITKDKQVVLSHDPHMNPDYVLLPNGQEIPPADKHRYALYQMNLDEIQTFDIGTKFYTKFPEQQRVKSYKPTLAAVIDSVQQYLATHKLPQVFYNIETKSKPASDNLLHPAPEEFVRLLMEVIEEKQITPWVIIQSFDVRTLQVLHQQYPHVRTSLLVENQKSLEENLQVLGFTPEIYSPYYKLVTPELLRACHQQGIKVIPWTVNKVDEIKRLKQMGADGIITDYPNLFQQL